MNTTQVTVKNTYFRHSLDSQKAFAELSGDFNPVHLDPIEARRTIFGEVVVHGVHNLLRAIERYFEYSGSNLQIDRLNVTFMNPVFLDEEVQVVIESGSENSARLILKCSDIDVADIRLMGHSMAHMAKAPALTPPDFNHHPDDKTLVQLENAEGHIDLTGHEDKIRKAFPNGARALGLDGVARLLGLTRLVGMHCPGLHSLFSGFDIRFSPDRSNQPTHYRVIRLDERISLITVSVEGGGLSGTINAFMRPSPVNQPDMSTVAKRASNNIFKGVRALVIGGSRGLGEISAKVIAGGGGDVAITYLSGAKDAERVAKDISESGNACRSLQLDVADPTSAIKRLAEQEWQPTHVLYFATPRISTRKSESTEEQFINIYSTGMKKVVEEVQKRSTGPWKLFYPSTVYVDEAPSDLSEYAKAKAAGEKMARELGDYDPDLTVVITRLPALATDQTASLINVALDDPLDYMAHLLSETLC